jgi:hypothetical protein
MTTGRYFARRAVMLSLALGLTFDDAAAEPKKPVLMVVCAVLAQSWRSQPANHEPRRNLRPRVAEQVGAAWPLPCPIRPG